MASASSTNVCHMQPACHASKTCTHPHIAPSKKKNALDFRFFSCSCSAATCDPLSPVSAGLSVTCSRDQALTNNDGLLLTCGAACTNQNLIMQRSTCTYACALGYEIVAPNGATRHCSNPDLFPDYYNTFVPSTWSGTEPSCRELIYTSISYTPAARFSNSDKSTHMRTNTHTHHLNTLSTH